MNKTLRKRRPPESSKCRAPSAAAAPPATLRQQARTLDQAFRSFARKVVVDDDTTLELPLRQFRVCMALFEGPLCMSELSQMLGVSQSAITQIADRLEVAGMVTRGPAGEDRRLRSLELTGQARRMLEQHEEKRIARMMSVIKRMSAAERSQLLASIDTLCAAASQGDS